MSLGDLKYAVNSSIGTSNFKTIDEMLGISNPTTANKTSIMNYLLSLDQKIGTLQNEFLSQLSSNSVVKKVISGTVSYTASGSASIRDLTIQSINTTKSLLFYKLTETQNYNMDNYMYILNSTTLRQCKADGPNSTKYTFSSGSWNIIEFY